MTERKAVSRRLRFEILKRDSYTCRYCRATDQPLTVDHVIPVALGGDDDPGNLVAACKDCNAGKTSTSPDAGTVAQVADDAVRWAAAMRSAALTASTDIAAANFYREAFRKEWRKWNSNRDDPAELDTAWASSVENWRKTGVPIDVVLYATSLALSNDRVTRKPFSYLAGIVWSSWRDMQDQAQAAVADLVERFCGHCDSCIDYARDPEGERYCYAFSPREEDEDPASCSICGAEHCAPGAARDGGYGEGFYAATDAHRASWRRTFQALQMSALIRVVDGPSVEYRRAV